MRFSLVVGSRWDEEILPVMKTGLEKLLKEHSQTVRPTRFYILKGVQVDLRSSRFDIYPAPVANFPAFFLHMFHATKNPEFLSQTLNWTNPKASFLSKRLALSHYATIFYPTPSLWEVDYILNKEYDATGQRIFRTTDKFTPHGSFRLRGKLEGFWDAELVFDACEVQESQPKLVDLETLVYDFVEIPASLKDKSSQMVVATLLGLMINELPNYNPNVYQNNAREILLGAIVYLLGKGEKPPFRMEQVFSQAAQLVEIAVQSAGTILKNFDKIFLWSYNRINRVQRRSNAAAQTLRYMLRKLRKMYGSYGVSLLELTDEVYWADAFISLSDTKPPYPLTRISAIAAAFKFLEETTIIPLETSMFFYFIHEQFHAFRQDIDYYELVKQRSYKDDDPALDPERYGEVQKKFGTVDLVAMNIIFDQHFNDYVEVFARSLGYDHTDLNAFRRRYIFHSYCPGKEMFFEVYLDEDDKGRFPYRFSFAGRDKGLYSRSISFSDIALRVPEGGDPGKLNQEFLRSALQLWIKPLVSAILWIGERKLRKEGTWVVGKV